jgi:hypothetical protein
MFGFYPFIILLGLNILFLLYFYYIKTRTTDSEYLKGSSRTQIPLEKNEGKNNDKKDDENNDEEENNDGNNDDNNDNNDENNDEEENSKSNRETLKKTLEETIKELKGIIEESKKERDESKKERDELKNNIKSSTNEELKKLKEIIREATSGKSIEELEKIKENNSVLTLNNYLRLREKYNSKLREGVLFEDYIDDYEKLSKELETKINKCKSDIEKLKITNPGGKEEIKKKEEELEKLKLEQNNLDTKNNVIYELLDKEIEHRKKILELTRNKEFLMIKFKEKMENFKKDIEELRNNFVKFKIEIIEKHFTSLLDIFNKLIELSEHKGEINYKEDILRMIHKLEIMNSNCSKIIEANIKNIQSKEKENKYKELFVELKIIRDSINEYLEKFKKKLI